MADQVADALERAAADTRLVPDAQRVSIQRNHHSSAMTISMRMGGKDFHYRVLVRRIK